MSKVKKSRTKISDVANHLGVHKTTVSRALNNSSGISKSTYLKTIMRYMKKLEKNLED